MSSGEAGERPDGSELPLPPQLKIPDDARELDADRWAYLLELQDRAQGREPAAARRPGPAGPRRPGPSRAAATRWSSAWPHGVQRSTRVGLVALATLLCVVAMTALLAPHLTVPAAPLPLAQVSSASGQVGSLLPDVEVSTPYGVRRSLQTLRPAVVVVTPEGCECGETVRALAAATREALVPLWLVGGTSEGLLALRAQSGFTAGVLLDDGVLAEAAGASVTSTSLTVLLVHADGVVGSALTVAAPEDVAAARLGPLLDGLAEPGAA